MSSYVRAPGRACSAAGGAGDAVARVRAALSHGVLALLRWQELAEQRRALATMDDYMLKDIGLSRADARREALRPFWDDGGEPWRISR
jgi:uncharacterized protein YjiS (DUF1127 family)